VDIGQSLRDLLRSPWLKKIPATSLVTTALAAMVHPALAAVGFNVSQAAGALAGIGFKIGGALLPSLLEAAKSGVEALGDWFERKLRDEPKVNEAAARTMAENAQVSAETLQEARPEDKEAVAAAISEGLKAFGGATAAIAQDYARAMSEVGDLRDLVAQMQQKIDTWASQTVEARRGSLIDDVWQDQSGAPTRQTVFADDHSTIRGVVQKTTGRRPEDPRE
jgi:hypothetical protein